jgi:hypothetical protein
MEPEKRYEIQRILLIDFFIFRKFHQRNKLSNLSDFVMINIDF